MTHDDYARGHRTLWLLSGGVAACTIAAIALSSWPIGLVAVGLLVWAVVRSRQNKAVLDRLVAKELADFAILRMRDLGDDAPVLLDSMVAVAAGGDPSAELLQRRLGIGPDTAKLMMYELSEMAFISTPGAKPRQTLELAPALIRRVAAEATLLSKRG
jgi:hypothetical protein